MVYAIAHTFNYHCSQTIELGAAHNVKVWRHVNFGTTKQNPTSHGCVVLQSVLSILCTCIYFFIDGVTKLSVRLTTSTSISTDKRFNLLCTNSLFSYHSS